MAEVPASASLRQLEELALLEVIGLMFPGLGPFPDGRVYELLPQGTAALDGSYFSPPFGVLADSGQLHLFAEVQGIRWAFWKIKKILSLHMVEHAGALVFRHLRYLGVPPEYDNGLGSRLPLRAMSSIICQWHQGSAKGASRRGAGADTRVQPDQPRCEPAALHERIGVDRALRPHRKSRAGPHHEV